MSRKPLISASRWVIHTIERASGRNYARIVNSREPEDSNAMTTVTKTIQISATTLDEAKEAFEQMTLTFEYYGLPVEAQNVTP